MGSGANVGVFVDQGVGQFRLFEGVTRTMRPMASNAQSRRPSFLPAKISWSIGRADAAFGPDFPELLDRVELHGLRRIVVRRSAPDERGEDEGIRRRDLRGGGHCFRSEVGRDFLVGDIRQQCRERVVGLRT